MNNSDSQLKLIDKSSNEVDSTISFLNSVLKHGMNDKMWNWEYNTFPSETVLAIVKHKNSVVGTLFMLPVYININCHDTLSGKNETGYLDQNFKGKGVFEKLYTYAISQSKEKHMKIMWGFTSVAKLWRTKFGFDVFDIMYDISFNVGKPEMKFFEIYSKNKIKNNLKYFVNVIKFLVFKIKFIFFKKTIKYACKINHYKIFDSLNDYGDIDKMYNKLRSRYNNLVHISMNEPFIKWRILNNVNLRYMCKFFYQNDNLEGYYIVSVKGSVAHINDFTNLSPEIAEIMLCHLFNEFYDRRIIHCKYFCNIENELNRSILNLFLKFGGKITKGMPFVFKDISDSIQDADSQNLSKNWYLNGLWTEGINY